MSPYERASGWPAHCRIVLRNSSACSCSCRIRFASSARSRQSSAIWPSTTSANAADRDGSWRRDARPATADFGITPLVPAILAAASADVCTVWNAGSRSPRPRSARDLRHTRLQECANCRGSPEPGCLPASDRLGEGRHIAGTALGLCLAEIARTAIPRWGGQTPRRGRAR